MLPDIDDLAAALTDRIAERLADLGRSRFLTVARAAEYTDLSQDSIRSMISSRKLTGLRPVPGRVLVDRRELDSVILSSTRSPRAG